MPSKGAPNMLPNVLPHADSDHVPVLADEVRELLAVRPGETVVDATFGAGGHARLLAQDLAGQGKLVAIDRDPGAKSYFDRFKAAAGVEVRFLRGDFAVVLTQLAAERRQGGRDPARPRHLVDAGRPARARLLVRDGRTPRHADGSLVGDHRRGDRQHVGRARAGDDLPPLRGGALRGADRPRDRASARRAALHADGRARGHDQARDPDTGEVRRGASGEAGLPGAPHRRERRAGPARGGVARGARDASAGRAARRDLLPLPRGPDREAVRRRAGEGLHVPAGLPRLRLWEGADGCGH